jgi:hypothetical protein
MAKVVSEKSAGAHKIAGLIAFIVGKLVAFKVAEVCCGESAAAICVLGSVGIHREFITVAARWIMEAKL